MNRYEVQDVMSERLSAMLKDLPQEEAMKALEELADEIMHIRCGVMMVDEMKKVKTAAFSNSTTYQPLNDGRAILISPFGYKVVSAERVGPQQRMTMVIEECTESERWDHEDYYKEPKIPHMQRGGLKKRTGKR